MNHKIFLKTNSKNIQKNKFELCLLGNLKFGWAVEFKVEGNDLVPWDLS